MSADESSRNRSGMFAGKAMEFVLLTRPVAHPLLQEVNDRFATGEPSVKVMSRSAGSNACSGSRDCAPGYISDVIGAAPVGPNADFASPGSVLDAGARGNYPASVHARHHLPRPWWMPRTAGTFDASTNSCRGVMFLA